MKKMRAISRIVQLTFVVISLRLQPFSRQTLCLSCHASDEARDA